VLNRRDDDLVELCLEEGVAWVPFFILGGAMPGLPKVSDDEVVKSIAARIGVAPSQVGLAWLLAHAPHILLIPGTADPDHLDKNVRSNEVVLTSDDIKALNEIAPR
jgi:pyridoxine 4-dehydrogenase